ncbi:MAG TPA: hypothetical protein VNZ26_04160, partial [Vicinamibacterales bacterium]|nr:hypothetical protein [Vicinamibacterales bacterium]
MYLVASRVVYHFDVDEAYWLDPFDHGRLRNGWGVRIFGSLRPPDDNDPSESIRAQDAEDLVQETCLRVAVIALIPEDDQASDPFRTDLWHLFRTRLLLVL